MHDVDILNFNTGLHYIFAEIPDAGAKLYTGLELKLSMLNNVTFRHEVDYLLLNDMDTTRSFSKGSATRMGLQATIGIDGQIRKNFYINTGFNFGWMNIIGKDDERGELFTPTRLNEMIESDVFLFQIFILLQYKFN